LKSTEYGFDHGLSGKALGVVLRGLLIAGMASLLLLLWIRPVFADDVPLRVAVQGFVKPEGNELKLLVRVPMDALGEIDFPKRGVPGSLIFSEADATLRAAKIGRAHV